MEQEITIKSNSACTTEFEYRGERLRLWIITGGTPALDLDDYFQTVRYPVVEMYNNAHWISGIGRYTHQEKDARGRVTPVIGVEVLPEGIGSVDKYLDSVLPRRDLARARTAMLPKIRVLKSHRKHDRNNRTYVWARIELGRLWVSPVTFDSAQYCGRCEHNSGLLNLFEQEWIDAIKVINPISDRMDGKSGWGDLSEADFTRVHDVLWALVHMK